jgi:uncharacterized membrane-anchored protein
VESLPHPDIIAADRNIPSAETLRALWRVIVHHYGKGRHPGGENIARQILGKGNARLRVWHHDE